MLQKKIRYIMMITIFILSSLMFTGCIPANQHVGKQQTSGYYKDSRYRGYYNRGYYDRGYYYR